MANIMSMVKLRNKVSRNGFDLSRKNAFTAKVGELLPVACIECLPDDSFDLEIQHFTRTRPVNTAAYTRIREYYDWFFVPTNLLWNKFNTVFTRMLDNGQHAQGIVSNLTLSERIPYTTISNIQEYLVSRKGKLNAYGYDRSNLSSKLLSYLGYGDLSNSSNDPLTSDDVVIDDLAVNLFPLLAYQKIYQDYYRNSQWERSYAPAWNLDYIKGTVDQSIPLDDLRSIPDSVETMFDLRYRNWNKDLFMGVLPSSQYGAASIISTSLATSPQYLKTSNSSSIGSNLNVNASGYLALGNTSGWLLQNVDGSSLSSRFSILELRLAEAEQMMNEITQSTQQDFKSQLEAHWNVSVSDAYSERCKFIDGSVSNLDISEVVNNNITADNEASIAGKGVGVGQGKCKFSTKVPGYLMCIYSAVPLLDYSISGCKRMCSRTTASDFAIPEFDAVGMDALPRNQLINTTYGTRVPSTRFDNFKILGYVPRYIDYKTAYDEVNGAFRKSSDGLNDWVAPLKNDYFYDYFSNLYDSGLSSGGSLTYQFFKVNPNILNPIFDVNADSSVSTDQLWVNAAFDIKAVRSLDRNGLPY